MKKLHVGSVFFGSSMAAALMGAYVMLYPKPAIDFTKNNQQKTQELEDWRSKVVNDCVETVVQEKASDYLRKNYPDYEACGKANRDGDVETKCYPSDPVMSLWGSVREAYTTGFVPEEPWPCSREYLLPIADLGRPVRAEADRKCSENPSFYIKYPIRE